MSDFLKAFLKGARDASVASTVLDVKALTGRFVKGMASYVDMQDTDFEDRVYLRASGMGRLCPAQWVLDYWRPHRRMSLGFQGHLYVDVGTMLHSYLQNHLLGPVGLLWGAWVHTRSGEVVKGYHPSTYEPLKDFRDERSHGMWEYIEESLIDKGWRISGHCDGITEEERLRIFVQMAEEKRRPEDIAREIRKIGSGTRRLLEIKTTNTRLMGALTGPGDISYDYRMQAALYQKMTSVTGTIFWYFNRDDFTQKALYYEAEPGVLEDAYAKADAVWTSIRDETIPRFGMPCATVNATRAKDCPVRDACWKRVTSFTQYVADARKAQPTRKFLDLSTWTRPDLTTFSKPCAELDSLPGTSL